jgi:two-component system CheB/CheR fusion protein
LERFFSQDPDGAYRIHKIIRDLLVFSVQDVIKDPPFSKLDLISCRNMLIYMSGDLQKKIIPLFHYALNPEGVLFLGNSESIGEFSELFAVLDRKWKLYLRRADAPGAARPALGDLAPQLWASGTRPYPHREVSAAEGRVSFRELTEQALLQYYAQAALLINGRGEILHIYGRTGQYLEPAPGDAGVNILPMAREGLRRELTTALHRVVTQKEPVHFSGLRVKTNGESITVKLTVEPAASGADGAVIPDTFLVILEEVSPRDAVLPGDDAGSPDMGIDGRIAALEQELRAKEEYLQTTIEELETSNEELRSTNEEMQSVNEELQSTNEELETSKEELQSVNEELSTVNAELQAKVNDLSQVNNDMNNLLAGTGIGTLFVDLQLRISRFTPAATPLINLIPSDVGRPVGHIASNLVGYRSLVEDVQAVLDNLVPLETEVQSTKGEWYQLRIRPYRTVDNVIEGAVITFVDITQIKKVEGALREARELAESIVATVREPLLVLDEDLKVVMANQAFYRAFQVEPDATRGHVLYELGNGQWDIPALRQLLDDILPQKLTFDNFRVTYDFEQIGWRTMLLNARRILSEAGRDRLILLAMEDITERSGVEETGE